MGRAFYVGRPATAARPLDAASGFGGYGEIAAYGTDLIRVTSAADSSVTTAVMRYSPV